jgi:hypothetical protein
LLKLRRAPAVAVTVVVAVAASGCITDLFRRSAGYDQRNLSLQTLALFNQRTPSRLAKRNWKGDWIFRRDRLELVDAELRNVKPDILMLQEAMAKRDSAAENDGSILRAGALADYEWREAMVETYEDTKEWQSMVVALGLGLKFAAPPPAEAPAGDASSGAAAPDPANPDAGVNRETWVLGADGYMMAATVDYEGQPVSVFNVQMPHQRDSDFLWYGFVQEKIAERLRRRHLCPKRVVVAGHLPGDEGAKRFGEFVSSLQLKDAAAGFCQIASRCYTATPTNDLFLATVGDESPTRVDRVFLHQSAIIYSSARNFETNDPNNRYAREFGLPRLWPTQRFGWAVSARLARCTDDELM